MPLVLEDGDAALYDNLEDLSTGEIRKKAAELQEERFSQLKRAASSFRNGNLTGKSCAAFYSDEGQALVPKIARLNRIAAQKIYCGKNGVDSNCLDLHHLTVSEAELVTRAFLSYHEGSGNTVKIVTGRGSHSSDGICKLLMSIWNLLRRQNRKYSFDGIATFTVNF